MAKTKKDPSQSKPARIKWNEDIRLGLDVLMLDFNFSGKKIVNIFCKLFEDHLHDCNDPEVTISKLRVQHKEKSKQGGQRNWEICLSKLPAAIARRTSFSSRIASIQRELYAADPRPISSSAAAAVLTPPLSASPRKSIISAQPATPGSSIRSKALPPNYTPSTRKRRTLSSVTITESPDDLFFTPETPRKKLKFTAASTTQQQPTPGTSSPDTRYWRGKASTRTKPATEYFEIRPGHHAWLPTTRVLEARLPPVYPPEEQANPNLTSLLYRMWDNNCQSPLTTNGFIAGRYKSMPRLPAPPPPNKQAPLWADMGNHLNRDPVASPFISASMNLMWIVRLALMEARATGRSKSISVIDPSRIPREQRFHAKPLHDALCKVIVFTNGAFLYHGKYEFMIYHKIPRHAIIKTITVENIYDLASRLPTVSATLRLDQIAIKNKSYVKTVLPALKEQKLKLTPTVVKSFAAIAKFLGLDHTAPAFVSGVVSDVCSGWGITIQRHTREEWSEIAETFAQAMCLSRSSRLNDFYLMKSAFLHGVEWGHASDSMPKLRADYAKRAIKKAGTIGLGATANMLTDELDAAKMAVLMFEKAQQRALPAAVGGGSTSRALLMDGLGEENENDGSGFDEDMVAHEHYQRQTDVRHDDRYEDRDDDDSEEDVRDNVREATMYDSDDDRSIFDL